MNENNDSLPNIDSPRKSERKKRILRKPGKFMLNILSNLEAKLNPQIKLKRGLGRRRGGNKNSHQLYKMTRNSFLNRSL